MRRLVIFICASIFYTLSYAQNSINSDGAKLMRAYEHLKNGVEFARLGYEMKAIQELDSAILLNPYDAEAYHYRAKRKQNLNDLEGAFEDYSQAIKYDPCDSYSLIFVQTKKGYSFNNRGDISFKREEYHKALLDFTKAVSCDTTNEVFYLNRGLAKHFLSDYRGAIIDFSKAIKLKSGFLEAYDCRARSKYELKNFSGAKADWSYLIEIDSNDPLHFYNRGLAKLGLKDLEGACIDFSKSGELGFEEAYHTIKNHCK